VHNTQSRTSRSEQLSSLCKASGTRLKNWYLNLVPETSPSHAHQTHKKLVSEMWHLIWCYIGHRFFMPSPHKWWISCWYCNNSGLFLSNKR